jgi:hypothetical protein
MIAEQVGAAADMCGRLGASHCPDQGFHRTPGAGITPVVILAPAGGA